MNQFFPKIIIFVFVVKLQLAVWKISVFSPIATIPPVVPLSFIFVLCDLFTRSIIHLRFLDSASPSKRIFQQQTCLKRGYYTPPYLNRVIWEQLVTWFTPFKPNDGFDTKPGQMQCCQLFWPFGKLENLSVQKLAKFTILEVNFEFIIFEHVE